MRVFISYRRASDTGNLVDRLADRLGSKRRWKPFLDTRRISPGTEFRSEIDAELSQTDVVLAIVTERWIKADATAEEDYVVYELESARRKGVRILPVLLGTSPPPKPSDLPDSLQFLTGIHCARLRPGTDFDTDFEKLQLALRVLAQKRRLPLVGDRRIGSRLLGLAFATVGVLILLLTLALNSPFGGDVPTQTSAALPTTLLAPTTSRVTFGRQPAVTSTAPEPPDSGGGAPANQLSSDIRLLAIPSRLLSTPVRTQTIDGSFAGGGPLGGGSTLELKVAARGGVPLEASSVVAIVTATGTNGGGFLTVYDCTERPLISHLNFRSGESVTNTVVSQLSGGSICIYAHSDAEVIVDAVGWVPVLSRIRVLSPTVRLVDTRDDSGGVTKLGPGVSTRIATLSSLRQLANIGIVDPTADGTLTLSDCKDSSSSVSVIPFVSGETRSFTTILRPAENGDVCATSTASQDLVIDILGDLQPNSSFSDTFSRRFVSNVSMRSGAALDVHELAQASGLADTGAVLIAVEVTKPRSSASLYVGTCDGSPQSRVAVATLRPGEAIAVVLTLDFRSAGCLFADNTSSVDIRFLEGETA